MTAADYVLVLSNIDHWKVNSPIAPVLTAALVPLIHCSLFTIYDSLSHIRLED